MSFTKNDVVTRYFKVNKGQTVQVEIHPLGSDDWYHENHTEEIQGILVEKLKEKFEAEAQQRRRKKKKKEASSAGDMVKTTLIDRLETLNGPTLRVAYTFKKRIPHSKHLLITRFGSENKLKVCVDHCIEPEKLVVYVWLLEKYRKYLQENQVKSSVSDYFTGVDPNTSDKQQTLKSMLQKGRRHRHKKSCHSADRSVRHKRRKSSLDLEAFMLHSYGKTAGSETSKKASFIKTENGKEEIKKFGEMFTKDRSELQTTNSTKGLKQDEYLVINKDYKDVRDSEDTSPKISESSLKQRYTTDTERKTERNGEGASCHISESKSFFKRSKTSSDYGGDFEGNAVVKSCMKRCMESESVLMKPVPDNLNDTVNICSEVCHAVHEEEPHRDSMACRSHNDRDRQMHVSAAGETAAEIVEDVVECNESDYEAKQMSNLKTSDTDFQDSKATKIASLLYEFDSEDSDFLVEYCLPKRKKENVSKVSSKLRQKKGLTKAADVLENNEYVENVCHHTDKEVFVNQSPASSCAYNGNHQKKHKEVSIHLCDVTVELEDIASSSHTAAKQFHAKQSTGLDSNEVKNSAPFRCSPTVTGTDCEVKGKNISADKDCGFSVSLGRKDSLNVAAFLYSSQTGRKNQSDAVSTEKLTAKTNSQPLSGDVVVEKLHCKTATVAKASSFNPEQNVLGIIDTNQGSTCPSRNDQADKVMVHRKRKHCGADSVGSKQVGLLSSESDDSDWAERFLAKKKKRFKCKKAIGSRACSQNYNKSQELQESNVLSKGRLRLQKTLGETTNDEVHKRVVVGRRTAGDHHQQSHIVSPVQGGECKNRANDEECGVNCTDIKIKQDLNETPIESRVDRCAKLLDRIKSEILEPEEETPGPEVVDVEDIFSDCFILDTFMESHLNPDEKLERQISKIKQLSHLNEDQLNYIITKNERYLREIFQGKRACNRHEVYKKGGKARVDLTYQVQLNVITEVQQDIVMEKLISIFCKRHHKYLDYIMKVMLPEILIKIYMDMNHTTHEETERRFWNLAGTSGTEK